MSHIFFTLWSAHCITFSGYINMSMDKCPNFYRLGKRHFGKQNYKQDVWHKIKVFFCLAVLNTTHYREWMIKSLGSLAIVFRVLGGPAIRVLVNYPEADGEILIKKFSTPIPIPTPGLTNHNFFHQQK